MNSFKAIFQRLDHLPRPKFVANAAWLDEPEMLAALHDYERQGYEVFIMQTPHGEMLPMKSYLEKHPIKTQG